MRSGPRRSAIWRASGAAADRRLRGGAVARRRGAAEGVGGRRLHRRRPSRAWSTRSRGTREGDYFHTNSIDLLDPAAASALTPGARQPVLLSMRELGAIGILDLADQRFGWALRGSWVGQHDPDLLPNGNVLLFDNYGHYGEGGISRVIEFDPRLAGDRLAVRRRQRPAVLQRRALGAGAPRQRQHADHGIRRRAAVRGHARGRDRLGVPEPGARRRRGRAHRGGVVGPAASIRRRSIPTSSRRRRAEWHGHDAGRLAGEMA